MSRLGWRLGALCFCMLTAVLGLARLSADDPPALNAKDRAKELVKSWDRPVPTIELSEKWRAKHPLSSFDAVIWAGDAERIAAVTAESEVLVIDSAQGTELARFRGQSEDRSDCDGAKGRPRRIAISHDGKYIALGFWFGVGVWDWSADKVVFVHKDILGVRDMRISNDGKWLCAIDNRVVGARYGLLDGAPGRSFTLSNTGGGGSFKVIMDPSSDRMVFRSEPLGTYGEVAMNLPDGKGMNVSPVVGNGMEKFAMGQRVRISGNRNGSMTVYMRQDVAPVVPNAPAIVAANPTAPIPKGPSVADIPHTGHWATMTQIREVMVSPDDLWGLAYDYNNRIELVRTDAACAQWRGRVKDGRIVAVRPQLNEVVSITPSGEMVCHTIVTPTEHPAWECEKWLRDALTRSAYDEIEAVTKVVASDRSRFPFLTDLSKFHVLRYILKATPADPEEAKRIGEQFQKFAAARPNTPLVAYLEARRLIAEGWEARGSGYADTVQPHQWEAFHKLIAQAHAVLKPAMEGDEPPLDLYHPWFTVARAASWPQAEVDYHVENLLRRLDRYHPALGEVGVLLLPRWGGDGDDASQFATMVANRLGGEAGDIAYARIAMELTPYEHDETFYNPVIQGTTLGFDQVQATRGVILAIEQEPYSKDLLNLCKIYNGIVRSREIAEALSKKQDPAD
jgi:hypothetical protein